MSYHACSFRPGMLVMPALLLAFPFAAPATAGSPGDLVLVTGWNSNNVLGYDATGSFTGPLPAAVPTGVPGRPRRRLPGRDP